MLAKNVLIASLEEINPTVYPMENALSKSQKLRMELPRKPLSKEYPRFPKIPKKFGQEL